MTLIRVDPQELRRKAEELESTAAKLLKIAHRALAASEGAPSYDGQFGPKVRALGAEAHAHLSARADRLHELADDLERAAARFEQVEGESVHILERWDSWFVDRLNWLDRNLADWLNSTSASILSQVLPSSVAHEAGARGAGGDSEEASTPWWAMFVASGYRAWSWFDRNIGAPIRESFQPDLQSPSSPTRTITPVVTPTPSPTSMRGPYGTPVPPGWTPTPPPPTGTPTADEIRAAIDERHRQWIDTLGLQIMNCGESSDVNACLVAVGSTIYEHYGWDLSELASSGLDNPLPNDSDEVRLMSPPIVGNFGDPVVRNLLNELDLSHERYSNFEPAFVEALKSENWEDYQRIFTLVRDHEDELQLMREAQSKFLEGLIDGPFGEMYFASNE